MKKHRRHGATITQAYKMARAGASYSTIADYLNERGLPVTSIKNGERETYWTGSRVPRLLANRVYLGEARSGEGMVNADAHDQLVDPTTWALAQRGNRPATPGLRKPSREAKGPPSILSNIARCAGCSMAMKPQGAGKSSPPIYRCSLPAKSGRCAASSTITKERLEQYVLDEFVYLTDRDYERSNVTKKVARSTVNKFLREQFDGVLADDDERATLVAEAADLERSYREQLKNTSLRREIGDRDHDTLIAALYRDWQAKLAEIEKLEPAPPSASLPKGIPSHRELVELLRKEGRNEELRSFLSRYVKTVFVRPAMSRARDLPVSDRVKIIWHHDNEELELPTRGRRFEPRQYGW